MKFHILVWLLLSEVSYSCFCQVSLDLNFGTQGVLTLAMPATVGENIIKSMELPNGKLIAVGASSGTNSYISVYQLQSTGKRDSTFGVNGGISIPNSLPNSPTAVAKGPNSSIYVLYETYSGTNRKFYVNKISQTGALLFSIEITHSVQKFVSLNQMAVQADGRILVFGTSIVPNGTNHLFIGRLNSTGTSWDPGFSGDGIFTYDAMDYGTEGNSLQVLADGSLLMGGSYEYRESFSERHHILFVHLTSFGYPSNDLVVGGILRYTSSWNYYCNRIYVRGDGTLHMVSKVYRPNASGNQQYDIVIDSYYTLNISYINSLYISYGTTQTPDDEIRYFDFIPGKGAWLTSYANAKTYITRIKEDGTLDSDFAPGGVVSNIETQTQMNLAGQCMQSDAKLLISGGLFTSGSTKGRMARINTRKTLYKNRFASVCSSVGYEFYGTTLNSTGTYTHLVSMPAADTLITLQLSLLPQGDPVFSIQATPALPACQGSDVVFKPSNVQFFGNAPVYYWKKNDVEVSYGPTYTANNLQNGDVISLEVVSNYDCRFTLGPFLSSPNVNVQVQPRPQPTISQVGSQLVSSILSGSFQWLNCNQNMAAITGATQSTYSPGASGSFAIRLTTTAGCSGVSLCKSILITENKEQVQNGTFKLKSGSHDREWLITGLPEDLPPIELFDLLGRRIPVDISKPIASNEILSFEARGQSRGHYLLRIGFHTQKIIMN